MSEEQKILFEIYLDNGDFKVRAKESADGLEKVGESAKKSESMFSKLKSSWMGVAAAVGVGLFAFDKVTSSLSECIEYASKLQETTNKFNVVFRDVKPQADSFAQTLVKSYGMATEESMAFLAGTGDILTGMGMQSGAALNLSNSVAKLGADLASFSNVEGGAERAINALTSSLTGEREALKAYGIVINEEMISAELRKKNKEKLTGLALQEAKAEATLTLALAQSKNAIGDMERSYDSYANVRRRVNSQMIEYKTIIGQEILPVLAKYGDAILKNSGDTSTFKNTIQGLGGVIKAAFDSSPLVLLARSYVWLADATGLSKSKLENLTDQQKRLTEEYDRYVKLKIPNDSADMQNLKEKIRLTEEQIDLERSKRMIESGKQDALEMGRLPQTDPKPKPKDNNNGSNGSGGKKKELADVSAYYAAVGNFENALQAKLDENKAKDLLNLDLVYKDKIAKAKGHNEELKALDVQRNADKEAIDEQYRQQGVIADATAWQAKQQAHLSYLRASFGFETRAFQGTQMIAQAGMSLMNEKNKVLFNIGKAATLTNIVMNTAEAITKGFSYGPYIGIPYSIIVGTAAGVQGSKVAMQKPPQPAKLPSYSLPSFAVGSWAVPYDMTAQIHKDEMIIPKTFADSVRSGEGAITGASAPAGGINIYVQGSVIDAHGLLDIVDDLQQKRARNMGATKYTMRSAY